MVEKDVKPRRPSPRVARKRKAARREILAAAEHILADGGVDAVTLAAVAERVGMTKPALYHYFPSKEALERALITTLLDDEIEALIAKVEATENEDRLLGSLIRAFYSHYIDRLDAFRTVYCRGQLYARGNSVLDDATLRDEVHPRTRGLFDLLEKRLAGAGATPAKLREARRTAYSAWISALGLMTIIGIADANDDPLSHPHEALLATLAGVFDGTSGR